MGKAHEDYTDQFESCYMAMWNVNMVGFSKGCKCGGVNGAPCPFYGKGLKMAIVFQLGNTRAHIGTKLKKPQNGEDPYCQITGNFSIPDQSNIILAMAKTFGVEVSEKDKEALSTQHVF